MPLDFIKPSDIVIKSSKTTQKQFLWEVSVKLPNRVNTPIWAKKAIEMEPNLDVK